MALCGISMEKCFLPSLLYQNSGVSSGIGHIEDRKRFCYGVGSFADEFACLSKSKSLLYRNK